jgi:hypothetical protein
MLLAGAALTTFACERPPRHAAVGAAVRSAAEAERGRGPAETSWPNEPPGFGPVNDQPWDRVTRPAFPVRGRVGRAVERLRDWLLPPAEERDDWNYLRRGASRDADIVADETAPQSPPHVLRMTFTRDMPPNTDPGVHWIILSPRRSELYTGWWAKLSSNWTCSPAGCGKITFTWAPEGQGQVYTNYYHPFSLPESGDQAQRRGPPCKVGANTEWVPYGQRIWHPNVTTTWVYPGQWHRIEFYYKWATSLDAADGVIRWWVNGVLNGDYRDVRYPACCFQQFEYAATRQDPLPTEEYMYVDHTYVSAPTAQVSAP